MPSLVFLRKLTVPLLTLLLAILAGCNLPDSAPAATPSIGAAQVQQTIGSRLTQAVFLTPTATLTPRPTDPGPDLSTPTHTAIAPATEIASAEPTAICDRAAAGNPIDLTIADNTFMEPGQAFTKKWALQNAGSCTWNRDYAVKFLYGELMGAQETLPLTGNIFPGQRVEIAIDMVAPMDPGTYRGNWKLRNGSNVLFGIGPNGSSPFWVQIVVIQPATQTSSPRPIIPEPSPTATMIPTPEISSTVTLLPGDRLDLDTGVANPESGTDLSYNSNPDGLHLLAPQENVTIGIYGPSPPSLADCQAAAQDTTPVAVENLGTTSLCYRTNQGLTGRALATNFKIDDYSLTLEVLTWGGP